MEKYSQKNVRILYKSVLFVCVCLCVDYICVLLLCVVDFFLYSRMCVSVCVCERVCVMMNLTQEQIIIITALRRKEILIS